MVRERGRALPREGAFLEADFTCSSQLVFRGAEHAVQQQDSLVPRAWCPEIPESHFPHNQANR